MPFFILSDTKIAVKRQLESEGILIRYERCCQIKFQFYRLHQLISEYDKRRFGLLRCLP